MEVSGDPLLPSRERWKFRRSSSRLGRTEGGCGRYFRSRITYYRTGRTQRISVARLSRGGSRDRGRARVREGRVAHPSNLPSETKKSEEDSPRAFPFLFDDRTRTYVPISLQLATRARILRPVMAFDFRSFDENARVYEKRFLLQ